MYPAYKFHPGSGFVVCILRARAIAKPALRTVRSCFAECGSHAAATATCVQIFWQRLSRLLRLFSTEHGLLEAWGTILPSWQRHFVSHERILTRIGGNQTSMPRH
jgi:hypothetical protein